MMKKFFHHSFLLSSSFVSNRALFSTLINKPCNSLTKIYLHNKKFSSHPNKTITILNKQNIKEISIIKNESNQLSSSSKSTEKLKSFFYKIFFPRDFPSSVKEGYLDYTKNTFAVGILINLMDFLATQVLINSMGVSKSDSVTLSAGLNWVIKDGIGQFSSIFFATKFNQSFEKNLKQWRIFTLLIYQFALYNEILCMKIKNPYTLLFSASLAQSLKMCATFGNVAARIGILDNFCKEKNISDLQNKSTSQSNLAFALGTLLGMGISLWIPLSLQNILKLISGFSIPYLYFAYKSIQKLYFPTLNFSRANILFRDYLRTGSFLSLKETNKLEGAKFTHIRNFHFASCSLDYAISRIKKVGDSKESIPYICKSIGLFKDQKFVCLINANESRNKFELFTCLQKDAQVDDIIFAFLYTVKVHEALKAMPLITREKALEELKRGISFVSSLDKQKILRDLSDKQYDIGVNHLEKRHLRYELELNKKI